MDWKQLPFLLNEVLLRSSLVLTVKLVSLILLDLSIVLQRLIERLERSLVTDLLDQLVSLRVVHCAFANGIQGLVLQLELDLFS